MSEDQDLIDGLRGEIDRLENTLSQITTWCREYPRAVYDEPTKAQWLEAKNLLDKAGGCSLVAISASRRKHVLDGIQKILRSSRKDEG